MKIVVANNYFYLRGGSERVMFDEIYSLIKYGYDVIPFSRSSDLNEISKYDEYYLPVTDYEKINSKEKIHAAVNVVYSYPMKVAFSKLLDAVNPSLVHAHNIYSGLTNSIIDASKMRDIPFIMTLHDLKLVCPSYLMLNHGNICELCVSGDFIHCAIQRCHKESIAASIVNTTEAYFNKIFKKYDWVSCFICPSKFLLEKVASAGYPRNKLLYVPNAIDSNTYRPNTQKGKYVLYVGRLSKEKGVLTLLQAFKRLNVPLRIAGTGPIQNECKEFVSLHDMNHVTFEGYCQGEKLEELFRQAAFLIIPSEWYENAPMSVLEAFAYGKPVIGSNIGGVPEQIIPGETGYLFEAGNTDALMEAVVSLWENSIKIENMGRTSRQSIETKYCLSQHMQRLTQIYNEHVK